LILVKKKNKINKKLLKVPFRLLFIFVFFKINIRKQQNTKEKCFDQIKNFNFKKKKIKLIKVEKCSPKGEKYSPSQIF
jgi:hypothetical protein